MSEAEKGSRRSHDASASALGYLYQVKVALVELLRRTRQTPTVSARLELLDDVEFSSDGAPSELLQVKHHVRSGASLSDASEEVWRTVGVWLDARGSNDAPELALVLLTTATAPAGSAASHLRTDPRNTRLGAELLQRAARTSTSQSTAAARRRFLELPEDVRRDLVESIVVSDSAYTVSEVDERLNAELRMAAEPNAVQALADRLIGWWNRRVVSHLLGQDRAPIDGQEVQLQIDDLREQFFSNNLPIDVLREDPELASLSADDRRFVRQLQLIAASDRLLELAIRDYKRAYVQRSRWARDGLLRVGELERYEQRLVDEWEHHSELMTIGRSAPSTEDEQQAAGAELYRTIQGSQERIRERVAEPFVTRGSYHMLADDLKVGWHPDFVARLRALLPEAV